MSVELLSQVCSYVFVEDTCYFVVDVEFHCVGFVDVHVETHTFHYGDIIGILDFLGGVRVEIVLFALSAVFYYIFLKYCEYFTTVA